MCPAHASAIDDRRAVNSFPIALLRDWKANQVQEHLEAREGWQLTGEMAKQALSASFPQFTIAITNSPIRLGGQGGGAVGAGGGGGGAIGPGARAGRGGGGGNIETRGDGSSAPEVRLDGGDPTPGSGGGGAGAIGPNAVAGDGGDGGNSVVEGFPIEPGDTFEIEIGKGGAGSSLPGEHSASGGDTVIIRKSSDGTLKRVVRSAGARGTKSGRLPDDWSVISKQDLEGGFCISTLMPANSVENQNGLVYMLGGGWRIFKAPSLPFQAVWNIIIVADWEILLPKTVRGLQVSLCNTERDEISRVALPLSEELASGRSCMWVSQLGAKFDKTGLWYIGVTSGEFLLAEIAIDVQIICPLQSNG